MTVVTGDASRTQNNECRKRCRNGVVAVTESARRRGDDAPGVTRILT
jgi:hypothetical protein